MAGLDIVDRPGVVAVLVMPVDIPLVRSDTIRRAIAAFHATRAPIVRVTHENRHGHPVIFGRAVFDELRRADYDIGAKAVLQLHAATILNVEVDDPAVLRDVDTPEDYRRSLPGPLKSERDAECAPRPARRFVFSRPLPATRSRRSSPSPWRLAPTARSLRSSTACC